MLRRFDMLWPRLGEISSRALKLDRETSRGLSTFVPSCVFCTGTAASLAMPSVCEGAGSTFIRLSSKKNGFHTAAEEAEAKFSTVPRCNRPIDRGVFDPRVSYEGAGGGKSSIDRKLTGVSALQVATSFVFFFGWW